MTTIEFDISLTSATIFFAELDSNKRHVRLKSLNTISLKQCDQVRGNQEYAPLREFQKQEDRVSSLYSNFPFAFISEQSKLNNVAKEIASPRISNAEKKEKDVTEKN